MALGRGLASLIPPKPKGDSGSDKNHQIHDGNPPTPPLIIEVAEPELIPKKEPEQTIKQEPSPSSIREHSKPLFANVPILEDDEEPKEKKEAAETPVQEVKVKPPEHQKTAPRVIAEEKNWSRPQFPAEKDPESIFLIEVEKIKPNPYQPRHEFDKEALQEMAQSIREFGIIQPLVVSKTEKEVDSGTEVEYQLIAGERRLMAAKIAGLERVPAIVKRVDTSRAKLEMAIIENVQRSNLNPIESAKAYSRLQDEFGLTQREIAARVGKSREVVANTLRLLNLPSEIQNALVSGKINESQARMLLSVAGLDKQKDTFNNLLTQKLSVRQLKERITYSKDAEEQFWEKKLEERLGAPVKLSKQGDGGKIVIQYYSKEEWQGIIDKLIGPEMQ